jgi:hypothetical protein
VARILRQWIELRPVGTDGTNFEVQVWEQIRTATPRQICALQLGTSISDDDLAMLMQIMDDVLRSALGRTNGIQGELTY